MFRIYVYLEVKRRKCMYVAVKSILSPSHSLKSSLINTFFPPFFFLPPHLSQRKIIFSRNIKKHNSRLGRRSLVPVFQSCWVLFSAAISAPTFQHHYSFKTQILYLKYAAYVRTDLSKKNN